MSRGARLRKREKERVISELAQELGRAPTETEVARRLGVEVGKHYDLLNRLARPPVGFLEARLERASSARKCTIFWPTTRRPGVGHGSG